jgi:hypothetical protein
MCAEIIMQRVWGRENKQLRAKEMVTCFFPMNNGNGKKLLTVEVVALPVGVIEDPKSFVPVIENWEELEEESQYKVVVVPIENINGGAHFIETYKGAGGNNLLE